MKFPIKDLFSKCDQIRSFPWIWSYLLNNSFLENFIFPSFIPYLCNTTVTLLNEVCTIAVYAANQTSSKSSSCYSHPCQYKCIPPKDSRGTNCQ